jgi:Protein of unknown function (DUF2457)
MALDHERNQAMQGLHYLTIHATSHNMPTSGDDEMAADVDEPPDHRPPLRLVVPEFHRSTIRPQKDHPESLLTKALQSPTTEAFEPDIHVATEMSRRRSTLSNASAASTADLTSDEGITSPARTNTPSPPIPKTTYISFAPYVLGRKSTEVAAPPMVQQDPKESVVTQLPATVAVSKPDPAVEALVKKRCITFACGGQRPKLSEQTMPKSKPLTAEAPETKLEKDAPKKCTIKFACPGPKTSEKSHPDKGDAHVEVAKTSTPPKEGLRRHNSRSPSVTRKPRSTATYTKTHRDSTLTLRRASQSPVAVRIRKPSYLAVDEDTLRSSEATRFHEFASDEAQEDDWIRKDTSETRERLTINDTLKKENVIRQLGKEVEEEALQDEEEDGDNDDDEDEEGNVDEDDGQDDETIDGSDGDASDGNETDNEAGFAESDDESDAIGDYQFWTLARAIPSSKSTDGNTFRATAHITASESSIDSLKHIKPIMQGNVPIKPKRLRTSRKMKIRPGTPDLPDSTDFVCGTLDEDRPLEEAYVSCMEARKREKHHVIPQDIDPSFPTSDPEDEEEDNAADRGNESEEHIWLHGKFEDSDEEPTWRRRQSTRKSPAPSPKRLHSPPPKQRLRSPPPRRLFGGNSPKRLRSPPPARTIRSPAASPTTHAIGAPIPFAPLGHRPGLTHTKSLPRTPNVFTDQYRASHLAAASAQADSSDNASGHTRGAIDIVKGLEHKRQRRKEKLYQKLCNRARKGQPQKKPLPGKGAERMRDLGLQLAGKVDERIGQAEYVISL